MAGSVPVAVLATLPSQIARPSQDSTAPAADAADAPGTRRRSLTRFGSASVCAAPGSLDAADTDRVSHAPPPAAHDADPVDVRGAVVPSDAVELVRAVPEQMPDAHVTVAEDDDADVGRPTH
jgi:hypothetical protein